MAKSKVVKANQKIEEKVAGVYNNIVGACKKIEDKFVDSFLTKEDETVEEAKLQLVDKKGENKK